jgi:hypothetical protein
MKIKITFPMKNKQDLLSGIPGSEASIAISKKVSFGLCRNRKERRLGKPRLYACVFLQE